MTNTNHQCGGNKAWQVVTSLTEDGVSIGVINGYDDSTYDRIAWGLPVCLRDFVQDHLSPHMWATKGETVKAVRYVEALAKMHASAT